MSFDFRPDSPLFLQIAAHLKREIIAGAYSPGSRLPSIRDMAVAYEVTPNTLQRALQRLEQEGVIYTERTNGKFITRDGALLGRLRAEALRERAEAVARELLRHGFSAEEIMEAMENAIKEVNRK